MTAGRLDPGERPSLAGVVPLGDHPAKFSEPILDRLRTLVNAEARRLGRSKTHPLLVVDPFAGVGRIHRLSGPRVRTVGIELQPRWAACHPYRGETGTLTGDMFQWLPRIEAEEDRRGCAIDVVASSPVYGNRLSDHHDARDGSTRHSYTHTYGRELEPNNSGTLPWGPRYWAFHARALRAIYAAMSAGGLLLWNVSDFYKGSQLIPAVSWHRGACWAAGFEQDQRDARIVTKRLQGVGVTAAQATEDGPAATDARATHEVILRFRKPEASL